jgi:hypothetical protein
MSRLADEIEEHYLRGVEQRRLSAETVIYLVMTYTERPT